MRLPALLLCVWLVPVAALAQTRAGLRAEIGSEYDTNATRAETVDGALPPKVVASPLVRAVVGGDVETRLGERQALSLAASFGGKAFTAADARSEDVVVGQGSGGWRTLLGSRWSAGLSAGAFDATQRGSVDPRDFRVLNAAARLALRVGDGGSAGVSGGYRWFTFKSDHAFDFRAPIVGADYRHVFLTADEATEWEALAGATFEPRDFEGLRLRCPTGDPEDGCDMPPGEHRRDRFWAAHGEVVRIGTVLLGAGYGLQLNQSNSFGESLLRHVFQARAAAKLPLDVYLSGKLELLLTRYQDPVYLGVTPEMRPLSIDDETKDNVKLEATRDFGERWQLVARYALYSNRIDTRTVHYSRQTFMLGLAVSVGK